MRCHPAIHRLQKEAEMPHPVLSSDMIHLATRGDGGDQPPDEEFTVFSY